MFFLSIRQVLPVAVMLFTGQFVADVQAAAPPPPPAPATAVAAVTEINVTSYANGAWILKKPAEYNEAWSAFWLLDERALTGWATPNGSVGPQEVLIALAEESVIKTVEFDNASADGDS